MVYGPELRFVIFQPGSSKLKKFESLDRIQREKLSEGAIPPTPRAVYNVLKSSNTIG